MERRTTLWTTVAVIVLGGGVALLTTLPGPSKDYASVPALFAYACFGAGLVALVAAARGWRFPLAVDPGALTHPDLDFTTGQHVGPEDRYVIIYFSRSTDSSHIYRARDEKGDREVAIKVALIPQYPGTRRLNERSVQAQRAQREALVGGRLVFRGGDPQFAPVYDHFYADSGLAIVMPWLGQYRTLREVIDRHSVDREGAARVAEQLGALIGKLRRRRIRHRDIKPENLFVPEDEEVICFDYGRANDPDDVAQTHIFKQKIGTAPYMSQRMLEGSSGNNGDEVFAMAATLYELLAGFCPRFGTEVDELLTAELLPLHEQRAVLREAMRQHPDRPEGEVMRSLQNLWQPLEHGLTDFARYDNDPDLTAESFGQGVAAALRQSELAFDFPLTVRRTQPAPARIAHQVGPAEPAWLKQSASVHGADTSTGNDAVTDAAASSADAATDQSTAAPPDSGSDETSRAATGSEGDRGELSAAEDSISSLTQPELATNSEENIRGVKVGAAFLSGISAAALHTAGALAVAARATLRHARTAIFWLLPRRRLSAKAGLATVALAAAAVAAVAFVPSLFTPAKRSSLLTTLRPRLRGEPIDNVTVAGRYLWVLDDSGDIHKLSAATGDVVGKAIPDDLGPEAITSGAGFTWVLNAVTPAEAAYRAKHCQDAGFVPAGSTPNPRCGDVEGSVTRIDQADSAVVGPPIPVGVQPGALNEPGGPGGIAYAHGAVWVTNTSSVSRVSAMSGEPIGSAIRVGYDPQAIQASGDTVWVESQTGRPTLTNNPSYYLTALSALTGAAGRKYGLGNAALIEDTGVSFAVTADSIWVVNNLQEIQRFNIATGRLEPDVRTLPPLFPLGGYPVTGGRYVWVVGDWDNNGPNYAMAFLSGSGRQTGPAVKLPAFPIDAAAAGSQIWAVYGASAITEPNGNSVQPPTTISRVQTP